MSLQLLKNLNDNRNGGLSKLISSFESNKKEPSIAWYPSAGVDFRDVLYLSKGYYQLNRMETFELKAPDIFIHSDYFPWEHSEFLDYKTLYNDLRTYIEVKHIEELPRLNFVLNPEIVECPIGNSATNRVIFMTLSVYSNKLGTWDIPLIYVFAENAAFLNEIGLPNHAKFSHIVNVRYGASLGSGGHSSGIWIKDILKRIGCQLLITDDRYYVSPADLRIYQLYPNLQPADNYTLNTIHMIEHKSWDGFGDIYWQSVS